MVKDLELDNLTIYLYVKNDESVCRLCTTERVGGGDVAHHIRLPFVEEIPEMAVSCKGPKI